MKKQIALEKFAEAEKNIKEAPAKTAKFITQERAISKLKTTIKNLHTKKNYEPSEIAKLLSENGIKTTVSEVKKILSSEEKATKKEPQNQNENAEEKPTKIKQKPPAKKVQQ